MVTEDQTPDTSGTEQAFNTLRSVLLNNESIEEFLQELAELAATTVITPATSCGVTTRRDGQYYTVASSDDWAAKLDETQYSSGQGPCLHTFESGQIVDMPDVATDVRWPAYTKHATSAGLKSSLSIPLTADGSVVGALNLYNFNAAHAFNGEEHRRVEVFAAQASTALALALRLVRRAETNLQLETALASRTMIDQALGILMAQQRCNADTAFALLRAHSQNNNRKLREVAADLITRTTGQAPEQGPAFRRPDR
ncbi:MAG: GAF and ANTAR domain-containing protein [Nocardioidaceae bacterium]